MDLVYVCRDGANEELRYSLRTAAANLDHDRVWIFGGAPDWVAGVELVKRATLATKYLSTTAHLRAACEHPDVSDPFVLMNDDFFVMQPVAQVPALHRGPVDALIDIYERKAAGRPYVTGMVATRDLLHEMGHPKPLSYELHIPLVVEKTTMLKAIDLGSHLQVLHKRTLYGNLAGLGGAETDDVKVYTMEQEVSRGPWLSSCDKVFQYGVGNVVRYLFGDPCRYEA